MSDDKSNRRDLKRRDFLSAVGGAGAAGVLGAGAITPAEAREAAQDVEQLTGYDRWYQIQRARWNDEVKELFDEFATEGKTPAFDRATAYETIDRENDLEYHSVVIPMEKEPSGSGYSVFSGNAGVAAAASYDDSLVVWSDYDEIETVGQEYRHIGEKRWMNRVHRQTTSGITTEQHVLDFQEAAQQASTQSETAAAAGTEALGCPDLDWQCILGMAASFGSAGFNCGTCVATGGGNAASCYWCVVNIIGVGAAICDPCPAEDGWPFNPGDGPGNGKSAKFKIGHEITALEAVNVRSDPEVGQNVTFTQPKGTTGWVKNGYVTSGGFTWWKISWENGQLGWSPERKIARN